MIDLTPHFVSLTVRNPRGAKFNFADLLKAQQERLRQNVHSTRGRGLTLMNEFADSVAGTSDGDGVKALF